MSIGGQAQPLRRGDDADAAPPADTADAADAADVAWAPDALADAPRARAGRIVAAAVAMLLAVGWIAFALYIHATRFPPAADPLAEAAALAPVAAAPLALIGVGWLIVARTSYAEARRFARTAADLREESVRLADVLGALGERMADHRRLLADGTERLLGHGDEAAARMAGVTAQIGEAGAALARQSETLSRAAKVARGEMDVLMTDLPRAEAQAAAAAAALREAGLAAHAQAGALDDRLTAIAAHGREAEETTGAAAARLGAQLARVESAGTAAGRALAAAGETLRHEADASLAAAAAALAEARSGIDAQGRAMRALIEETDAAFAGTGAEAARRLGDRLDDATARLAALGGTLAAQEAAATTLLATLDDGVQAADARFAGFDAAARARIAALVEAIGALRGHGERTLHTIGEGSDAADMLVVRTRSIHAATDAIAAALGTGLPPLLDAAASRAMTAREAAEGALPAAQALADGAEAAAARLADARAELEAQQAALAAIAAAGGAQLDMLVGRAQAFTGGLAEAGDAAEALASAAGPTLVDALVRVRETAAQAAEKARAALAAVIPEAADALGRASAESLERALTDRVEDQMARIVGTTEDAVRAAQGATERLMRQMLTIADTSSAVERRIAEAREEAQERDEEGFPHQAALLIEQLNSLSIDVAKALSGEPGDAAWAAYLRGDRSVFTRRAVKLLDAGELKEIARRYGEDDPFRAQVNRYIHDFEAMLRRVLASRDGTPLGVTLLSSDIGKLYVALAQAIERLRR